MPVYFSRKLENIIPDYLENFSSIGITGPRQSGKSTLLKKMFGDQYTYISFDDYRYIDFFKNDPIRFMEQYNDKVIFDEAQKVPEIFEYIKLAIDNDRDRMGKFIITGSSQFSFTQGITESLAGRIGLLTLLPLQYSEVPEEYRYEMIYKGCYPELVKKEYKFWESWYASYFETFILRDVKSLANIGDLHDFRQFVSLLATHASQILNMSSISRSLGISVTTLKRWISLLEAAYVIFLLPPYWDNLGKRIKKSPKIFFYDTGLVSYLTGVSSKEIYEKGPMAGKIFENFVVAEIRKKLLHNTDTTRQYYYRTSNDVEIDLILEKGSKRKLIEIKKSATFRTRMSKPIETVIREGDQGLILYDGENFKYKDNITVMNFGDYLVENQ